MFENDERLKGLNVQKYNPIRINSAKLNSVENVSFKNSFLTDVSGKDQQYTDVDFSYSIFTRGYFHKAKFRNCKFIGTHFFDCNFRNTSFSGCDFRYANFSGTLIESNEILENLPAEPNIKRELLQILRKNANSVADVDASRIFVIKEIDANEEHLRRAWRGDENYYKQKYNGFRKKFGIFSSIVIHNLNSFFWGHGERLWKIFIPVILLLIISSLIVTADWAFEQKDPTISSIVKMFSEKLAYYISLFLDIPNIQHEYRILWLEWVITLARFIVFGVLVAALFRWLSRR